MSKTEILKELPKLTPEERQEVRVRLAELEQDEWLGETGLTEVQKSLIEQRCREMDANPRLSISWETAREQLLSAFKR